MSKWIKCKTTGIRYRHHEERKHGVGFDKYFTIRYKIAGKEKEEGLGWATDGWTEKKAAAVLSELKANSTIGIGPVSLCEKREIRAIAEKKTEESKQQEDNKNISFGRIFELFLVASKEKKKNPRSWKREEQLARLHIFPVISDLPLTKIAHVPHIRAIQKNMEAKSLTPRTIRYAFHVIRIVFHFAMDEGYFSGTNPALEKSNRAVSKKRSGIEYPQEDNKKERYLSREEANVLLKELTKRSSEVHDMAMLGLYAGLRFGEIAKLTWENVDVFQGTMKLRQTKNGKDRTAYMNQDVQQMFARRGPGEHGRLVFPARGKDNKPHYMISHMYYEVVKKLFNQGVTDKKQWVNFHTLRHTFASWLVEDGTDIYKVQELLGHGDLKMTERYAHNDKNQLKQAVMKLQKE
ncbi:site-specific integrase [Desulfopila sp. IMCC35006]|uniref:tyrosine-type recombinase/integrase n=1 Tax=Desulfopila sp. IMCC35006 TaxID=2569542 RepID=UPI0010ABBF41|nr:site-specific integrase [Desulfopila sp. IMCC35006]TKB26514.1 site-specific integrase [Desulfopila sp. IMCC35006]